MIFLGQDYLAEVFDPYSVFLAISTNIPQRLKIGFVVQGHTHSHTVLIKCYFIVIICEINRFLSEYFSRTMTNYILPFFFTCISLTSIDGHVILLC